MKILGIIIIIIGVIDVGGTYLDFDLWGGFLGLSLPDLLWQYSGYIELGLGYVLFKFGSKETGEAETEAETEFEAETETETETNS